MRWRGMVVAVAIALCMPCGLVVAQGRAKPAPKAGAARAAISWKEALSRVGENVVVEGTVMNVKVRKGKAPDLLIFDENWRESLSVAIFDKEKFGDAQATYMGKRIRVRGKVTQYRNAAQIKVSNPSQITVLE